MRITSANSTAIDIRLNESVRTGAGSIGDRGGMRITLEAGDFTGVGETAPIPGQAGPKLEELATEIGQWCLSVVDNNVEDALAPLDGTALSPLSRFAAHTALIDLQARSLGIPVSRLLNPDAVSRVPVNGLIGESNPAAVHQRALQLVDQGVTAIKLKVGALDNSMDITRIVAASEAAGGYAKLRLDANGGWTAQAAARVIGRVGKHRISYIEEPTSDPSEYLALMEETGVQVALDLAVTNTPDEEIAAAGVGVVIVKPAALGGIDRVVELAQRHPDHQVVVTSSIDREVALAAAIHAAAALPSDSGPHGLATGRLIANMDEALLDTNGAVRVPDGPGVWNPSATPTN